MVKEGNGLRVSGMVKDVWVKKRWGIWEKYLGMVLRGVDCGGAQCELEGKHIGGNG